MTDLTERALQVAMDNGETAANAIRQRDELLEVLRTIKITLESPAIGGYAAEVLHAKVKEVLARFPE